MDELKHRKRLDDLYLKSQKKKILRIPILILAFLEIAIYHFQNWFSKHLIKIILICLLIIVIPIFGSYIFLSDNQENSINRIDVSEDYNVIYADNSIKKESIIANDNITSDLNDYSTISDTEDNLSYISNTDILATMEGANITINNANTNIQLKDFDKDSFELILINKQHPLPEDFSVQLGEISGNSRCDKRIIDSLYLMISDANKDGVIINVCSPYRNHKRQVMLFNQKIKRYMKEGYSYKDSYMLTSQAVTIPGSSEHEAGLSIDFNTNNYLTLDEGFANTAAGIWLKNNSYKYGFILRYPSDKEDITGIEYEPWHFRYVGVDAAYYIYTHDLCFEEFIELINR